MVARDHFKKYFLFGPPDIKHTPFLLLKRIANDITQESTVFNVPWDILAGLMETVFHRRPLQIYKCLHEKVSSISFEKLYHKQPNTSTKIVETNPIIKPQH